MLYLRSYGTKSSVRRHAPHDQRGVGGSQLLACLRYCRARPLTALETSKKINSSLQRKPELRTGVMAMKIIDHCHLLSSPL